MIDSYDYDAHYRREAEEAQRLRDHQDALDSLRAQRDKAIEERDEALAALRGAARAQDVLRASNEHLTKSRDEARRVARELAMTSMYAGDGVWIDSEHAIDALGRYQAAEQIALAYPDTTKKDSDK